MMQADKQEQERLNKLARDFLDYAILKNKSEKLVEMARKRRAVSEWRKRNG